MAGFKLDTPRLYLREFTPDDAVALAEIHVDPMVAQFIGGIKTLAETRARINEFIANYREWGFSKWAVILRSSEQLIGRCGPVIEMVDTTQEVELGYTLARNHWGQGYATEAARTALEACRTRFRMHRVISLIDPSNTHSQAVARKLGMRFERNVMRHEKVIQLFSCET